MGTSVIRDARAWRASTIDDRSAWYYSLPERCLSALDQALHQLRRAPRPLTELRASEYLGAACAEAVGPVLTALECGRGFAILQGLPCERYSTTELQAAYWLVGQLLGRPVAQNVQGVLLYDVRHGARFP